jgi:uncharacterized protein involved in outer membrane biogenesis
LVYAIVNIDLNDYKKEVSDAAEQATGRPLNIEGEISLAWSLVPKLVVEKATFSNAKWGTKPYMLSLDRVEVNLAILPLFARHIQVTKVILNGPDILIETNAKGRGNWVFEQAAKPDPSTSDEPSVIQSAIVNELDVEQAKIEYRDGVTGETQHFVIETLSLDVDDLEKPLDVLLKAVVDDIPVAMEGQLGGVNALLNNVSTSVDLKLKIADVILVVEGNIAIPHEGKGLALNIELETDSLALSELAGSDIPEFGDLTIKAAVSDEQDRYSLKNVILKAGKTDLSGDISVSLVGKTPSINAALKSEFIDVVELSGSESEQAETEADTKKTQSTRLFSDEPLALEGLKQVDATITLAAETIHTASLDLTKMELDVNLKNGHLVVDPLNVSLAGSQFEGILDLNAESDMAVLKTKVQVNGFKLTKVAELKDRLSGGNTDVFIQATGRGQSVKQLMAGLNGKAVVKVGESQIADGTLDILGADFVTELVNLLNPFSKEKKGTELACAVVNFNIKNGIATADKGIAIRTGKMNIVGDGSINLKTEKIDIKITPEARAGIGINMTDLVGLVRMSGTLAQPGVAIDKTALLEAGLSTSAAVASGGLTILAEGLIDRATADENPCQTALGIKP